MFKSKLKYFYDCSLISLFDTKTLSDEVILFWVETKFDIYFYGQIIVEYNCFMLVITSA